MSKSLLLLWGLVATALVPCAPHSRMGPLMSYSPLLLWVVLATVLSVFFAPARYRVVKIMCSSSEVVL
jgi:hypothetical protein